VFIGRDETGPLSSAVAVNTLAAFHDVFGGFVADDSYLLDGVTGFFANGGTDAMVVRMPDEQVAAPLTATRSEAMRPLDYSLVCAPEPLHSVRSIEDQRSVLAFLVAQSRVRPRDAAGRPARGLRAAGGTGIAHQCRARLGRVLPRVGPRRERASRPSIPCGAEQRAHRRHARPQFEVETDERAQARWPGHRRLLDFVSARRPTARCR
jgi:hypothetical protein